MALYSDGTGTMTQRKIGTSTNDVESDFDWTKLGSDAFLISNCTGCLYDTESVSQISGSLATAFFSSVINGGAREWTLKSGAP